MAMGVLTTTQYDYICHPWLVSLYSYISPIHGWLDSLFINLSPWLAHHSQNILQKYLTLYISCRASITNMSISTIQIIFTHYWLASPSLVRFNLYLIVIFNSLITWHFFCLYLMLTHLFLMPVLLPFKVSGKIVSYKAILS